MDSSAHMLVSAAIIRGLDPKSKVTIDAVLLLMHRLEERLEGLDPRTRRAEILKEPMAAHMLLLIREHDSLWRTFAIRAVHAQETLCLYAVLEGSDHYITSWLNAKVEQHSHARYTVGRSQSTAGADQHE